MIQRVQRARKLLQPIMTYFHLFLHDKYNSSSLLYLVATHPLQLPEFQSAAQLLPHLQNPLQAELSFQKVSYCYLILLLNLISNSGTATLEHAKKLSALWFYCFLPIPSSLSQLPLRLPMAKTETHHQCTHKPQLHLQPCPFQVTEPHLLNSSLSVNHKYIYSLILAVCLHIAQPI